VPAGGGLSRDCSASIRKQLKLDEMITKTYPIDAIAQAFDDMLAGRNAKGVLVDAMERT